MFCKHEWKLLSETTTVSKVQHLAEIGVTTVKGLSGDVASRKLIQIAACDKCGKLKRFVENI